MQHTCNLAQRTGFAFGTLDSELRKAAAAAGTALQTARKTNSTALGNVFSGFCRYSPQHGKAQESAEIPRMGRRRRRLHQ